MGAAGKAISASKRSFKRRLRQPASAVRPGVFGGKGKCDQESREIKTKSQQGPRKEPPAPTTSTP